ncbi:O-methyltransferase [Thermoascus aurantiacus ATCC 26904]
MATPVDTVSTPDKSNSKAPGSPKGKWKFPEPKDNRHLTLLHHIYSLPNLADLKGNPQRILAAIDDFSENKQHLMNIGPKKGKLITDLIARIKPQTMIELGGFVGYSAILFGDAVRRAGGKRYLSLEQNPEFAAVANLLVDLAGLKDFVKIIVGPSSRSLHELYVSGEIGEKIELLFLDHHKAMYTVDLKLCEHYGLIRPGSVVAADNVIVPGAPEYLDYVRSSVQRKREMAEKKRTEEKKDEELEFDFVGNPNLVYESTIHEMDLSAGRRDGVEITRCVGEEKA